MAVGVQWFWSWALSFVLFQHDRAQPQSGIIIPERFGTW
jgi:hypothetical protein